LSRAHFRVRLAHEYDVGHVVLTLLMRVIVVVDLGEGQTVEIVAEDSVEVVEMGAQMRLYDEGTQVFGAKFIGPAHFYLHHPKLLFDCGPRNTEVFLVEGLHAEHGKLS